MADKSLVAGVPTKRTGTTGLGLADSFLGLNHAVNSGSWVQGALAGGALATTVAMTVLDPFSALLSNGLGWAMEYFEPLREVLDHLAGVPDQVAANAQTWSNVAGELQSLSTELQADLASDLPGWQGTAADSYHLLMANNVDGLAGLSVLAATMAAATQAAGNLVQFTRDIVRDLVADLVARVIVWAAESLLVVTIPMVAVQIASAVVKWAGRILSYTSSLVTSLTNLRVLLEG